MVPSKVPGADPSALGLNAREKLVWALIDGHTDGAHIGAQISMDDGAIVSIVERLSSLGAVTLAGDGAGASGAGASGAGAAGSGGDGGGTATEVASAGEPAGAAPGGQQSHGNVPQGLDPEVVAAAMAEENDLAPELRWQLLEAEGYARRGDFWRLLVLEGGESGTAVKKAYFAATRRFHPDQYFGQALGSFAERLDRIFEGVRQGYEILADSEAAEAYAERMPPPSQRVGEGASLQPGGAAGAPGEGVSAGAQRPAAAVKTPNGAASDALANAVAATVPGVTVDATPSAVSGESDQERKARLAARREAIRGRRRALFAKPFTRGAQRGRELYERGKVDFQAGNMLAAAKTLRMAVAMAPDNPTYQRLYDEAEQQASLLRAKSLSDEAAQAGDDPKARAEVYTRASDLAPTMTSYARLAAEELFKAGALDQALEYIKRALATAPRRKEVRLVAADICRTLHMYQDAMVHLRSAAALDPDDPHVKNGIQRLENLMNG